MEVGNAKGFIAGTKILIFEGDASIK